MSIIMNRRFFLQTASGAIVLPITGVGALPAFAAREQLVVRFEYDLANLDPANRTGSVEDNLILAVCQNLARFKPGKLEWEPEPPNRSIRCRRPKSISNLIPARCSRAAMVR